MINKTIQDITETDLQDLVDNRVLENKNLEYKQDLNINKDSDKKEFLADVSSFANASGGDLIIGIGCDKTTGEPGQLIGLNYPNIDSEILRIENLIRDGINPKIGGLRTWPVKLTNSNAAIVIRIPQSWNSPHMVIHQGSNRFYTRSSNGKHLMDIDELRDAFTISDKIASRINSFRMDRVGKIYSNDSYISLPPDFGKVVLHIIPFSAFSLTGKFEFGSIRDARSKLLPMRSSSCDYRYNIDGFMGFINNNTYTQVFKNGIIEAVDASLLRKASSNDDYAIPSSSLEEMIVESFSDYLKIIETLKIDLPILVTASLIGIQNCYFATKNYSFQVRAGERVKLTNDVLNLSETLLRDFTTPAPKVLKPVLDSLWNAYGFSGSKNYDAEGKWKG